MERNAVGKGWVEPQCMLMLRAGAGWCGLVRMSAGIISEYTNQEYCLELSPLPRTAIV
jgi:hypothetical protein